MTARELWTRASALTLWLAAGTAAAAPAQKTTDSAPGYASADSARQAKAAPVQPPDPVLAKACSGLPAGAEAPGLLTVVFQPGTPDADRTAAVRAVRGTLAGTTPYGEDYVRLEPDAGPLPAVADLLIRQVPVTTVSAAPCPGPPQAPISAPAPTPGAAGGTVSGASPSGATTNSTVRDSTARDSTAKPATRAGSP